jgi:hypothetical protein
LHLHNVASRSWSVFGPSAVAQNNGSVRQNITINIYRSPEPRTARADGPTSELPTQAMHVGTLSSCCSELHIHLQSNHRLFRPRRLCTIFAVTRSGLWIVMERKATIVNLLSTRFQRNPALARLNVPRPLCRLQLHTGNNIAMRSKSHNAPAHSPQMLRKRVRMLTMIDGTSCMSG